MVPGLKNYIEKHIPHARELVVIEKKIDEWKCDHEGGTPIVVLDFAGFYRLVCSTPQGQLDVLCGKHKRSLDATESILKRFQSMGVQLEFFCGGSSKYLNKLLDDRNKRYLKQVDRILQLINAGCSPENIVRRLWKPIYNNGSYIDAAIMLAEKYGRVHKSYENEHERDIALYASQHNAVAVISSNSDLILINSQWSFWDIHHFDITSFEIWQIDRAKVRDFLELNDKELPLVGVLTEKRFTSHLIYNFLRALGSKKNKFKAVAKFIIDNFRNKSCIVPEELARILSPNNIAQNAKTIKESLQLFDNYPDHEPVIEDELFIVAKTRLYKSYVYEFINNLPVPVQPLFLERLANQEFMAAALKLHQRQMGIVLQHKHTKQSREIICFNATNINNVMIDPIYPVLEVPSLLQLYQDTADKDLLEIKFKLLCWIVSDHIDYTRVKRISEQYICAVLTLVYLIENQFITNEEADCILYCLGMYEKDPKLLNSIVSLNSIADRPFQIVFLYDKFYQFILYSMTTVGLSKLLVPNQLDGVYFHQQYESFIHMTEIDRDIFLKTVEVADCRLY